MDFPTIVSIGSLLNTAIGATKSAREIAKDTSDTDLKEQISAVYDVLLDLKERTLALDEENRQLKAQLAHRAAYTGPAAPHGYYFKDDEKEHPLCPTCFQNKPQRIGFMGDAHSWNGGVRRVCKLCSAVVYEQRMR